MDAEPHRYAKLFDPLLAAVQESFSPQDTEIALGVALLTPRGKTLYEHGALLGCFRDCAEGGSSSSGLDLINVLSAAPRQESPTLPPYFHTPGISEAVVVGGRRFVTWRHECRVRMYASANSGSWSLLVRAEWDDFAYVPV